MVTYDDIKQAVGDQLDNETIAKCVLVLNSATPPQVTWFSERLPYTSLQNIVEYCEANA